MATEASLTDQAANKEVEEIKVDDDINDVNEDIVFQPKVLERKENEEEEPKVEDSTIVEASVTEQKEISDDSHDTLVEDMKKEEENKELAGGATDKESNSEAAEQKENSDHLSDALVEGVKVDEENKVVATEKESESKAVEKKESLVDSSDVFVEDVKKEEENMELEGVATKKEPEPEAEQKESLDDSSDAVVEDVKNEEENKEPEGVATEKNPDSEAAVVEDVKEEENKELESMATEKDRDPEAAVETTENSTVCSIQESAAESAKDIEVSEGVATEKEQDSEDAVETTENSAVSLIQESAVESSKDIKISEGVAAEKERNFEAAVETTENSAVSLIQGSAAESAKDIEVSDAEMKTSDDLPSALEIEDKEVEAPGIPALEEPGLATFEAAEATIAKKISPEAVASSEPSKEETSSDGISGLVVAAADISNATSVETDQVNEEKDIGAAVTGAHLPTSDDSSIKDSIKEPVKEESTSGEEEALKILRGGRDKVEKVTLEEEPIVSDALNAEIATEVAEKSESLDKTSKDAEAPLVAEVTSEGVKDAMKDDKTTLVETSRDLDMDSTVKEAESEPNPAEATETIIDKSVNKDSEQKKDENEGEKTEEAKDDDQTKIVGEGQEAEVPVKSSLRQSNSIMSKVKHSIVKVKKAIIGKSSSSKNMSPELKDDTKAK